MPSMLITVGELKPGHLIVQFPYAGPEKLPVLVVYMRQARRKGYLVVEGEDATGRTVLVPCGHYTQSIRVQETSL